MASIDLTSNVAVTAALLSEPWEWRVRVVEQIDVDSPVSARRRRSLQSAALRPLIARPARIPRTKPKDGPDEALLVMPIAPIPKGPLLEFDVAGPGGSQAFLVQRADIATREAAFLALTARGIGVPMPVEVLALVEAALGFTDAQWERFRPDLRRYLVSGLEDQFDIATARAAIALSASAADVLAPFADPPALLDSAVETPALVVPSLVAEGTLAVGDVVPALTSYVGWLTSVATAAAGDGDRADDARTLLEALADYGTHYDLMAIVRVPLDEPFLVKVADRRPLRLSVPGNAGEQSVVIADARSNHVALRVTDPNARLSRVRARSATDDSDAYGTFTTRKSPQVHASYAFEPDRDYRIRLTFRVAALRRLQLVPYTLAAILVVTAAAVVGLRPAPGDLALTVGPATFAASVLLAREPSALGSRLRLLTTTLVVVATAVLIAVAGWDIWRTHGS